jgi:hypothetical protein
MNGLASSDDPSVNCRARHHRESDQEKEMYSVTNKNPFLGNTSPNNETQWVIQPPTADSVLHETQVQQDELYNTVKSKADTMNPQLQDIRTVFARTVLTDRDEQSNNRQTMSLAEQLEQDVRTKKLLAKQTNDRWISETKSLRAMQEEMASKRSQIEALRVNAANAESSDGSSSCSFEIGWGSDKNRLAFEQEWNHLCA